MSRPEMGSRKFTPKTVVNGYKQTLHFVCPRQLHPEADGLVAVRGLTLLTDGRTHRIEIVQKNTAV